MLRIEMRRSVAKKALLRSFYLLVAKFLHRFAKKRFIGLDNHKHPPKLYL